jgi:acetoin utilization deacetylase AcuC-like enzyme
MGKYARLRSVLAGQGLVDPERLRAAEPAPRGALEAVHDPQYVHDFVGGELDVKAYRRLGFPWSPALVARCLASAGATLEATFLALEHGTAGTLAGGTHHAHRDFGAGYCAFNDLAVAARAALDAGAVQRVLVVDVDVHQGDGTAAIFADEPRIFTLSLHGARNFPAHKPPGDLDVALADGTGDDAYLAALQPALEEAFARARPDLVLVQGGVDPLAQDRLGRLSLTHGGLAERDRRVLHAARGLPLVWTLGGGYGQPIEETVAAHAASFALLRDRP